LHAEFYGIGMDIIYIRDLRIETVIGVYPWERSIRQTVRIDLDLATDIRQSAETDDLGDTLSYHAVAVRVMEFVGDSDYLLLETLAEHIATLILEEFPVPWLRLTVGKPRAVAAAREVGVIIERASK
jgi:dihydroneopterin aldolase